MPLYAFDGRRPVLGRDVWVAPSADLIGDAVLGDEASVWFGAVIRADNTRIAIGARTNVQEGAMLHSDPGFPLTIGAGVTIGHHAILHGCTVGDDVLVGMGATLLNGAVIGDGCLVGANALVTERQIFPPGSLVLGSPARVVRPLAAEAIDRLRASADAYAIRARSYASSLARVDR